MKLDEDEEVIEQALNDLSLHCRHSVLCDGVLLKCTRYQGHQGRCKDAIRPHRQYAWWGRNKPAIPGTDTSVWRTTGGFKHELLTKGRLELTPPDMGGPPVPFAPKRHG